MNERTRILMLGVIMAVAVAAAVGTAGFVLYATALEAQRARLIDTAGTQAAIIQAIAQDEAADPRSTPLSRRSEIEGRILAQLHAGNARYSGADHGAELTIASIEGDRIVWMLDQGPSNSGQPQSLPRNTQLAEPTRRALAGESGTLIGPDRHGHEVMAAYAPVPGLNWAVVAKVDMTAIRIPFVRAGLVAAGAAGITICLGLLAFLRLTRPVLKRLQDSERQLRLAVTEAPIPVMIHAEDGRVLVTSKEFHRLSGYTSEQIPTTDAWIERANDAHSREVIRANQRELHASSGPTEHGEYEILTASGEKRVWDFHSAPLGVAGDGKRYFITMAVDVTRRREAHDELAEAKAALEAASQAKDRFLSTLSHELRTPLTPVLVALSSFQERPNLPPELARDLAMMRQNIERESQLIDGLLDLSRVSRGHIHLRPQVASAHELLHEALAQVVHEPGLHKPTIRRELAAQGYHVKVDRGVFMQVCWNIIKNALQSTSDSGTLTLRSSNPSPDLLEIQFIDTGIGIAPEFLPHVFDVFATTRGGNDRRPGGLGLGLTIARSLIQQLGGTLTADSAGHGKGATLTLRIPVTHESLTEHGTASVPAIPAEELPVPVTSPQRILLVEDHADTSQVLVEALTLMGHKVHPATTVQEAIAAGQAEAFDLLLSDIGLPDGSGADVMRWFAQHRPIPGIALSGYGLDTDIEQSRQAGFAIHLVKPVPISDLRAAIQEVTCSSALRA